MINSTELRKLVYFGKDSDFVSAFTENARMEGHMVYHEHELDLIHSIIFHRSPLLVIFDLSSCDENIVELCSDIRKSFAGFVLFLADEDNCIDQILAFELGADDFVVKPVNLRVLMARINSLFREKEYPDYRTGQVVSVGQIVVDAGRREAFFNGELLSLTTLEFDLLWLLIKNAGKTMSRDKLGKLIQQSGYDGINRSIDRYICRIRKKLRDNASIPFYVKTVRGSGYQFAS